jgi:hypothetical protein
VFSHSLGYPAVWEYDTASDKWTANGYFRQGIQTGMVSFTIDNYAYVGPGGDGTSGSGRFWQYNPVANSWTRKSDFPGAGSTYPAAFSIGHCGYEWPVHFQAISWDMSALARDHFIMQVRVRLQ